MATNTPQELHYCEAHSFVLDAHRRTLHNIIAVKPFGLVGTGVRGTIALETLNGSFETDLTMQTVDNEDKILRYSVGDRLEVEVTRAHEDLGRIDLRGAET